MYSYVEIPDQDETARALREAGHLLDVEAVRGGLEAAAVRRKSRPGGEEDGLWVGDLSTDVFEPVRRRRQRRLQWEQVQSLDDAAARMREFLAQRPDLQQESP